MKKKFYLLLNRICIKLWEIFFKLSLDFQMKAKANEQAANVCIDCSDLCCNEHKSDLCCDDHKCTCAACTCSECDCCSNCLDPAEMSDDEVFDIVNKEIKKVRKQKKKKDKKNSKKKKR